MFIEYHPHYINEDLYYELTKLYNSQNIEFKKGLKKEKLKYLDAARSKVIISIAIEVDKVIKVQYFDEFMVSSKTKILNNIKQEIGL
jgi:hypothetical protein